MTTYKLEFLVVGAGLVEADLAALELAVVQALDEVVKVLLLDLDETESAGAAEVVKGETAADDGSGGLEVLLESFAVQAEGEVTNEDGFGGVTAGSGEQVALGGNREDGAQGFERHDGKG